MVLASSSSTSGCRTFIRRKRTRNLSTVVLSDDESDQAFTSHIASDSHCASISHQASIIHQPVQQHLCHTDNSQAQEPISGNRYEPTVWDVAAGTRFMNRDLTDDGKQ
ncbi:hypothetical protein MKW98_031670, partial [Papaver atlanticum]